MSAPHLWLRSLRRALGLSQIEVEARTAALGEACRVSQSYLSKLEGGCKPLASLPPLKLDALRRLYQVSPGEWVAHTGLQLVLEANAGEVVGSLDFVRMPVRALAAAGFPLSEDGSDTIDNELVPREEFRGGMVVLEVQGESMTTLEGGLRSGDRVYVDTADLELREGKIYVLHVGGGGTVVKRVRHFEDGFWLTSDNPNFAPIRPDQATVIGRVYFHQPRGRRL